MLHQTGLNDRAMARTVNRDRTTIRQWRLSRGLPSNYVPKCPTAEEVRSFLEMHGEGLLDREIAGRLDRDRSTISAWRRKRGLPSNRPIGSGSVFLRRARSLDAPLFEDGGQLHDYIRDDSWSDWLEEMGATVW